jgi:uncharacterized membrane protein
MQNRLSIRGNAVEPVLVMFPLGLLAVAVLLDVFHALGGPRILGMLAYCTVVAGLLGGMTTALAVRIGELATGSRPATRRFLLDAAVLVVFAVVMLLRLRTPERTVGPGLLLVELVGLGVAVVAGVAAVAPPDGPGARAGAATVRLAALLDDPAAEGRRAEETGVHPGRTMRSPARRRRLTALARFPAGGADRVVGRNQ